MRAAAFIFGSFTVAVGAAEGSSAAEGASAEGASALMALLDLLGPLRRNRFGFWGIALVVPRRSSDARRAYALETHQVFGIFCLKTTTRRRYT